MLYDEKKVPEAWQMSVLLLRRHAVQKLQTDASATADWPARPKTPAGLSRFLSLLLILPLPTVTAAPAWLSQVKAGVRHARPSREHDAAVLYGLGTRTPYSCARTVRRLLITSRM